VSIEIKLKEANDKLTRNLPECIDSIKKFKVWFDSYLSYPVEGWNVFVPEVKEEIINYLKDFEGVDVRDGVSGGCYGARDGNNYEGLTLWIDASILPERWIDEGDEIVNIRVLFDEYSQQTLSIDGETFLDLMYESGVEIKSDNTYNYIGHNEEDVLPLQHVDYSIIEFEKSVVVVAKFHCGGDVRGNYTDYYVYGFSCIDDVYSVLSPYKVLSEE